MKYILLLLCFFLFSCDSSTNNRSVTQETIKIVDWYTNTLEWSIEDSKAVRDLMNSNNDSLKNALQNVSK